MPQDRVLAVPEGNAEKISNEEKTDRPLELRHLNMRPPRSKSVIVVIAADSYPLFIALNDQQVFQSSEKNGL